MSDTDSTSLTVIAKEIGHCWKAALPAHVPSGDDISDNDRSLLRLFEDGRELGPPHSHHAAVRESGGGLYSHWGDTLFFSTSDNSDPRANGRSYCIAASSGAAVIGRDPTAIPEAVAYAAGVARARLTAMRQRGVDASRASILEIGPGKNFGTAVLLACEGARVTVADRFLSSWIDGYHHQYFAALAQAWDGPHGAIDRLLKAGRFEAIMTLLPEPAEQLRSLPDADIDVVLSCAVLEHVYDLRSTMAELRRVSRCGGWQFHSVDLKDHQGYGRPLDHLLLGRDAFDAINATLQNQRGCQTRASEMEAIMGEMGFAIEAAHYDTIQDDAYFREFLGALRNSASPYAAWPERDLQVLGTSYHLRAA